MKPRRSRLTSRGNKSSLGEGVVCYCYLTNLVCFCSNNPFYVEIKIFDLSDLLRGKD